MTIGEAARRVLGEDVTYDTALPNAWVAELLLKVPFGIIAAETAAENFVWAYDNGPAGLGRPCALTENGNLVLELFNSYTGSNYPITANPVDRDGCPNLAAAENLPWGLLELDREVA